MYKKLACLTCLLLILSCSKEELTDQLSFEEDMLDPPVSEQEVKDDENNEVAEPIEVVQSYQWVMNQQQPSGLLTSAENTDFVSLYDNALSAIIFIERGEFNKAEKILDFFKNRINSELLQDSGGFFQFRDASGENGSRRWMGDNAWLLIALNHYHSQTGNNRYHHLSHELETWLRGLQDSDGGLWGGKNGDGTQIHKVTEGMITAFHAVRGYDGFHQEILRYLGENRWSTDKKILMAWPENPQHQYALDLHTLGYLILEDFPVEVLTQASKFKTTQNATLSGTAISGYCFDEDRDVVWMEGTAQMAVAWDRAALQHESDKLLEELEKTFIMGTSGETSWGIPYSANHGTNYGSGLLWDHADITPALSSTIWYLFAKKRFNPMQIPEKKEIPEEDKFWLQPL